MAGKLAQATGIVRVSPDGQRDRGHESSARTGGHDLYVYDAVSGD